MTRRILTTLIARSRQNRGFAILQAMGVVVVASALLTGMTTLILLEVDAQQQSVTAQQQQDISDGAVGWVTASLGQADLPLLATGDNTVTYTVGANTNPPGTCYQISLDQVSHVLSIKGASYSGSGNCSLELGSASAQTLASTIVNTSGKPVFDFYSSTDNTQPIADATTATGAKSVDVNLQVQGKNKNNTPLGTLYHLIFGGSVTTPKLQSTAVTATKVANNAIACTAALRPSPQECNSTDSSHTTGSVANNTIDSSSSDSYAFRSFSRAASLTGSAVNYGPPTAGQVGLWRTNQSSPSASGLSAGSSGTSMLSVNWSDLCVPGKALYARGVYTTWNPADASGALTLGARMMEMAGPSISATPSISNATSTFAVVPSASTPDGGYSLLESGWRQIDAGSCSASNDLLNADPYWYVLETKQGSPSGTPYPYTLVNAAIEIRYTPAASVSGATAPDAPTLVSPADDTFVSTAKPVLSARFTDQNQGDTGQLTFQICADSICGTVLYSGNSVAGIANGATGTWTVPSNLPDGTYYWRAQATDSTALVSPWSSTNIVKVAATAPSVSIDNPISSITGINAQYYDSATKTLWFSTATSSTGSFKVSVHGNGDPTSPSVWGIDTVTFPTLGAGWTGGGTVQSPTTDGSGNTSPDLNQTYSWTGSSGSAAAASVTLTSIDGQSASTTFNVQLDTTIPTGGTISYPNGSMTGTATITGNTGSDSGAGVANGGTVQQATEAWSGGCPNSWGSWTDLPGMPMSTGSTYLVNVTITGGTCYKFRYIATDRVGNQQIVTSGNVIQGGNPPVNTVAPAITDNQSNNPPHEGDTLIASTGTWTGDPTITYSYQWQRCGYKSLVLQDHPYAYWRLGETTGTLAFDTSGNGYSGTYTGSPTLGAAGALATDPNNAVSFSGSGQYVYVGNRIQLVTMFTLEAWINTTVNDTTINQTGDVAATIFGDNSGYDQLGLYGSHVRFSAYSGTAYNSLTGSAVVNDGQWHHIVLTETATGTAKIYVDGALDVSGSVPFSSSGGINIIGAGNNFDDGFTGKIDDAAVYLGTTFGLSTISADYNAGHSGTGLCNDISGATSSTYAPDNDAGDTILVKVTATNPIGSTTAQSTQTGWVTGSAPSNTALPTISDNTGNNPPQQGDLMIANPGSWIGTGDSYTYQWQRCNTLPAQILADAPSLYYRLDESSGAGYAFDSSGNARDGVYANSPTLGGSTGAAGAVGTSATFNGSNSYVQAPSAGISGSFTLETWVKINGTGTTGATDYDTIMGTQTSQRLLWESATGRLVAQINGVTFYSTGTISTGSWHLIDFVYNGSTEAWYIDGAAAGSQSATTLTWPGPFRLGAYDVDNYMLNGSLDEVAVYPSALSSVRVSAHYSAGTTACSNIAGATATTYTPVAADANATLKVTVTASNNIGVASATSAATISIGAAKPTALVAPATSGSTGVGQQLSTTNGTFSGTTPITYTYQWQRMGYLGTVESDNPYLYLRLNETGGSAANDTMLNDSGLYVGSPTLGQGPATTDRDRSVLFNGTSQYVQLNNTVQFDSGNFTIDGWFQSAGSGVGQIIWQSGVVTGFNAHLFVNLDASGHLQAQVNDDSNSFPFALTSASTYNDNKWHYFAFTRSGSTFTLYADGAQVGQTTSSVADVDHATAPVYLGVESGAPFVDYFNGHLDDIAAYKSALTAPQVTAHYTAGTSIGVNISGETTSIHTVVTADGDSDLRAVVTGTNGSGSFKAGGTPKNVPPAPINITAPVINGIAEVGQNLVVSAGGWRGSNISWTYQWQDCNLTGGSCTNISGATNATYTPVVADVGSTLVARVTATNPSGSTTVASSYVANGESYGTAVYNDQPLDYWRLGESSGTTAADTMGTTNGTYFNTPTLGQPSPILGTANTAASFNGTNQYVSAGSSAAPYLQQFTLEGWEKMAAPPSGGSNATVIGSLGSYGQYQLGISVTTGYPFVSFYDGANWHTDTYNAGKADGTWHYLVGTWDGTNLNLYVDGSLQVTQPFSGVNPGRIDCPFQIGGINCAASGYSGQYLNGSLDDVAVYDHALTSTQVLRHWQAHDTAVVEQTPQNTAAPAISGDPQSGQALSATQGTWTGTPSPTYSYQWQRCGYKQSVLADSPVQLLRLGEANGTAAADETGNGGTYVGFNSSLMGKPGALAGDPNTAVQFNGSNRIATGPAVNTGAGASTTVEFWMYWTGGDSQMPFSWSDGGIGLGDLYFSGGTFGFNTYNSDVYGISSAGLANSWHLIDAVFPNGAPANAKLYVDGQLQTLTQRLGTTTTIAVANGTGDIGDDGRDHSSYRFQGYIDEFAMYTGALPAARVAAHYEAGITSGGTCTNISGQTGSSYTTSSADIGNTVRATVAASNSGGVNYARTSRSGWVLGTYQSQIGLNGPTAWWRLGETSGTAAADSTGNGYGGTYSGAYTLGQTGAIAGDSNTAVSFPGGSSGRVTLGTSPAVPNTMSMEAWVKTTSASHQSILSTMIASSTGMELALVGGEPYFYGNNGGSSTSYMASGSPVLNDGNWHQVVFAEDGATLRIYVDSALVGTTSEQTGIPPEQMYIGYNAYYGITFNGTIDEVTYYNYSLSASQITNDFNAGTGPNSAVGNPVISGTAQDQQQLSASTGFFTGIQPRTYSYQWKDCDSSGNNCVNVSGATSSTYTLQSSDIGKTLRVQVTMNNAAGSVSSTSAQTAVVVAAPPANTSSPTVSGTASEGSTLSASQGSWTGTAPITYGYQWQTSSNGGSTWTNLVGATFSAYVPTNSDIGHLLRIAVTATNSAASTTAYSVATAAVAGPTNMIPNSDFENSSSATGWTSTLSLSRSGNWYVNYGSAAGNDALWQTGSLGSTNDVSFFSPCASASPNQLYSARADFNHDASWGPMFVTIYFYSSVASCQADWANFTGSASTSGPSSTGTYLGLSASGTSPSGTGAARLRIGLGSGSGSVNFYIDNVLLIPGGLPPSPNNACVNSNGCSNATPPAAGWYP